MTWTDSISSNTSALTVSVVVTYSLPSCEKNQQIYVSLSENFNSYTLANIATSDLEQLKINTICAKKSLNLN